MFAAVSVSEGYILKRKWWRVKHWNYMTYVATLTGITSLPRGVKPFLCMGSLLPICYSVCYVMPEFTDLLFACNICWHSTTPLLPPSHLQPTPKDYVKTEWQKEG